MSAPTITIATIEALEKAERYAQRIKDLQARNERLMKENKVLARKIKQLEGLLRKRRT